MPLLADSLNDAPRATGITFERGSKKVQENFPTLQLFTDAPPVLGESSGLSALPGSSESALAEHLNNLRTTRLYIFAKPVIYVILGSIPCTSYGCGISPPPANIKPSFRPNQAEDGQGWVTQ